MADIEFTKEQQDILASKNKITLVRACPGSGKTRVFVEVFQSYLAAWKSDKFGIAALSFTMLRKRRSQGVLTTRWARRILSGRWIHSCFDMSFVLLPMSSAVTRKAFA